MSVPVAERTVCRGGRTRAAVACAWLLLAACSAPVDVAELLVVDRRPHPSHGLLSIHDGVPRQVFQAEPLGHIMQFDVRPAAGISAPGQVVVSYVGPPASATSVPAAGLFTLAVDDPEAALERLLAPAQGENLLDPVYAPDGTSIYFVRVTQRVDGPDLHREIALETLNLESGSIQRLGANAIWPTPSPDGRRLAAVSVDPTTLIRGLTLLELPSGEPRTLIPPGRFPDIDAPVFSADGAWVYFFASSETTTSLLDLMGFVAHAHSNQPGLWWRVAVDGGAPEALTREPEIISDGSRIEGRLMYTSSLGLRMLTADGAVVTLNEAPYFGALGKRNSSSRNPSSRNPSPRNPSP